MDTEERTAFAYLRDTSRELYDLLKRGLLAISQYAAEHDSTGVAMLQQQYATHLQMLRHQYVQLKELQLRHPNDSDVLNAVINCDAYFADLREQSPT